MLESLLKAIGVITMNEQQRVMFAQKQAIRQAADKLIAICENIEEDYRSVPTWADVDRYWTAMDLADEINETL